MLRRSFIVVFIFSTAYLLSCRGPEGPIGPQGNGYDGLTDPAVKPRVIYTYPIANTVGPYDNFSTTIQIRFNKIMDRTSLRRAFHLTSPAGDITADTSTISGSAGDVFSLFPKSVDPKLGQCWKIGETYTLRIDTSAKDINGNNLIPEFSMTFTPEPFFRIKSSSPANGSVGVDLQLTVSFTFNNVVDTSIFHSIVISPPLPGKWRFNRKSAGKIDSTYMSYAVSSGNIMKTNTEYHITVSADAHDKQGNTLPAEYVVSYTTYSFDVISSQPGDGAEGIPLFARTISIIFNDLVDTSTVRAAFTLTPSLVGFLKLYTDRRLVEFTSVQDLPPSTTIEIAIDTTLRSITGDKLSARYTSSFTTAAFQILGTSPSDGSTDIIGYNSIYISLNATVDTGSVRSAFLLSPPQQGLFDLPVNENYFRFSPLAPFLMDTIYTVTISTALRSAGGSTLLSPYVFSFRTGSFNVSYSYPQNGMTGVSRYTSVGLNFNLPIDTSTMRNAFHVDPAVDGYFSSYYSSNSFSFYPDGGLAAQTIYTVTIDTTMRSLEGYHMKQPYTFVFATGD